MQTTHFAVDIGNSRIKLGIFRSETLIEVFSFEYGIGQADSEHQKFKEIFARLDGPLLGIISSVVDIDNGWLGWLKSFGRVSMLDHKTPLPFRNAYKSPETVGTDRLAVVAGAKTLNGKDPSLIVNAGTAITYDFIDKDGVYHGGAISPGLQMRYQALHTFTAKLPLLRVEEHAELALVGYNTDNSIRTGVQLHAVYEMGGVIEAYRKQFSGLQVYLSGGDSKFFVTHLKSSIFAIPTIWQPDLVLIGLNTILMLNDV